MNFVPDEKQQSKSHDFWKALYKMIDYKLKKDPKNKFLAITFIFKKSNKFEKYAIHFFNKLNFFLTVSSHGKKTFAWIKKKPFCKHLSNFVSNVFFQF